MCCKSTVLLVTALCLIEAQYFTRKHSGAVPDLYESISLRADHARKCTFDVSSLETPVIPRVNIQQQKIVCIESTLSCVQSGQQPCSVSCSDPAGSVWLNISALKMPGVMSQLSPQLPVNSSALRICQHVKTLNNCQLSIARSNDPLKLLVRVRFAVGERLDDDCNDFRRLLRTELDICKESANIQAQNGVLRVVAGWICMIFGVVATILN